MNAARKNHLLILGFSICLCLLFACQEKEKPSVDENPITTTKEVVDVTDEVQLPITDSDKADSERNDPQNASWKIPPIVFEKMGDLEGQTVADIGAGVGYLSFLMILRKASVIAIDTDPMTVANMNLVAITILDPKEQKRFEARVTPEDKANLQENEVDRVMIMHVVTFLGNRQKYFKDLRQSLKPGGELMIMDFKMKKLDPIFPEKKFRIYPDIIEEDLYKAGYENIVVDDTSLDAQYIITATNPF